MQSESFDLFRNNGGLLELYNELIRQISNFGKLTIKPRKSYSKIVVLCNHRNFAYISLLNGDGSFMDKGFKVVFSMNHIISDSRIQAVTEPHPGRFSHHVAVETASDINEQLIEWLQQAFENA
ncbi:MAG: DUF5655 domain-containing protein [Oscillospiraceae bacterium]|nr:DUF5655 domain-containing protein [Oscillospiraceae bacterium]